MALLKHNPAHRIGYDEFFAHEFLDLEHAATKENYDKAVALINKAIEADTKKNAKEAFYLYCEALRYFIPILTSKNNISYVEFTNQLISRFEVFILSCIIELIFMINFYALL